MKASHVDRPRRHKQAKDILFLPGLEPKPCPPLNRPRVHVQEMRSIPGVPTSLSTQQTAHYVQV